MPNCVTLILFSQFFTKDVIVPSPWTDHEGKQLSEYHSNKCEYTENHLIKDCKV